MSNEEIEIPHKPDDEEEDDFSLEETVLKMKEMLNRYQSKDALYSSFEQKKSTLKNNVASAFIELLQEFEVIVYFFEEASFVTKEGLVKIRTLIQQIKEKISPLEVLARESKEGTVEEIDLLLESFHELALQIKSLESK